MQGFNMGRYVPPDLEGVVGLNTASGKGHALGKRASKLAFSGALTVRFEMPFAVWCDHCPKDTIIGQGVRFNAEKKKVGNYYSTPIWGFRFKHAACGGWLEVRTDPASTDYIVHEGGRRRDYGANVEQRDEMGNLVLLTEEEREKRRTDAFAALEGKKTDEKLEKVQKARVDELREASDLHWNDPDAANRRLRGAFRIGRKKREEEDRRTEALQERMGTTMELLPESEEDRQRAALVDFGSASVEGDKTVMRRATARGLFDERVKSEDVKRKSTREKTVQHGGGKHDLQEQLRTNTRARMDPFQVMTDGGTGKMAMTKEIVAPRKRKRDEKTTEGEDQVPNGTKDGGIEGGDTTTTQIKGLVAYDSD